MGILTVDYKNNKAGIEFVKSCHETGFAVIKNHPIDYNLVENLFTEWHNFFKTEYKHKYPYDKATGDGYVSPELSEIAKGETIKDIKEFYHVYFPWGRYPQELSDNTKIYFDQIIEFAKNLMQWLEDYTPLDIKKYFSESLSNMVDPTQTVLRILHYPPFNGSEPTGALRAAAHEDINLITLLPASNQTGLQVLTKDNNWLDVGTKKGEIIINIGDMLQECSNYYYISTKHRVVNPKENKSNQSRFSMPLFVHARPDVYLSKKYPLAKLYLTERLTELGLTG